MAIHRQADQSFPHLILICPALTSSPPGPLISSQSFALALFPVQPAIKASLALARSAFSLIQIGSLGSLVSIAEKSLDLGLNILDHILCFLSNGRDGPKVGWWRIGIAKTRREGGARPDKATRRTFRSIREP